MPREALDHRIVDPALRVGPVVAVAADRAVDDVRVDRADLGLAEPQTLHRAGAEILYEDIRLGGELLHDLATLFFLDVDRDRSFAAVCVGVERRDSTAKEVRHAGDVARPRRLHLHHAGALVGQHHGCERT